ncbi:hypothetical protein K449DRAFT_388472 [Hypoxylon sp. EC38]|nr:hypothetical protein K449DRAFT_388472 [Hypoxylon sp. EC38]
MASKSFLSRYSHAKSSTFTQGGDNLALPTSRFHSKSPSETRRTSRSSSSSKLLRRILTIRRRSSDDSSFDHKGSLGLNLLFEPSEPLIEYVFVHGLGGGSIKTWCAEPDPSYYWPKEWLPKHVAFRNVRIHSFGYNADFLEKGQPHTDIYDFGQALLQALRNSQSFTENPIVFIAHSMGGLVIKQAYLLARQDPSCHELASRIYGMVFLATPHRGSDLASTLNNVLRISVAHGPRAYVSSLERSSDALNRINDAFRHYQNDLRLYSFFETQETSVGPGISSLIVRKESATLGYLGEQVALLNANHRGVCKFQDPSDSNYLTLLDCFSMINASIMKRLSANNDENSRVQMQKIENYLDTSGLPIDDLKDLEDARIAGSCEWFSNRHSFQSWMDASASAPNKLYWVSANPGTGKSVLSSYVINTLEDCNQDTSYFFFRHGDKLRSTLAGCLRSIAFQMAFRSALIRSRLLSLMERDVRFDKDNAKAIWRKVFESSILKSELPQTQYWVIDALDECIDITLIFSILSKLELSVPIKVFMTSRRTQDIVSGFDQLRQVPNVPQAICEEISFNDSKEDIWLYLEGNKRKIHLGNDQKKHSILKRILEKSQGCFLWVRLILDELDTVWTLKLIEQVLDEVPQEMDMVYKRAIDIMSSKPAHAKAIAKAILVWTVCAITPMTLPELLGALELDIGMTVEEPESALSSLCAQLIYVDKRGRVLMVHLTAKAFLLDNSLDLEFTICPILGHQRLARICLQFLTSDEMKPPRIRRSARAVTRPSQKSPFVAYACVHFSEHIRRTTSNNQIIVPLLYHFFSKNVFVWIEHVASSGSLSVLNQTANSLKNYFRRQTKYFPLLTEQSQLLEGWIIDLNRLVAKFGNNLIGLPSSIHWLIPSFCPASSSVAKVFGNPTRRIQICGVTDNGWDDRLACIDSQESQAYAVACGEAFFAVGLSHFVQLYHVSTCQEWKLLEHGSQVRHLIFDRMGDQLVSGGRRDLKLWDLEQNSLKWHFRTEHDILSLSYADKESAMIAALRNNSTYKWSLQTGEILEKLVWPSSFDDEGQFRRPPLLAVFSPDQSFLAIVYRGRPITIWDLESDGIHGLVGRENQDLTSLALGTNTSPVSLVFNTEESSPLLVVAYEDGDLCLFDYEELKLVKLVEANALIVACSPDGTTLATGNSAGVVQLLEFETLQLLYRINAVEYGIRALSFTSDGTRVLDVRGTQCNVWEPALASGIARKDDASNTPVPPDAQAVGLSKGENTISTMSLDDSGDFFFTGYSDGSVCVHSVSDGRQRKVLYRHVYQISITLMIWAQARKLLVTADAAGRFIVYTLKPDSSDGWHIEQRLLDVRGDVQNKVAIRQILLNPSNELLLISTLRADIIWDLSRKSVVSKYEFDLRGSSYWVNNPLNKDERLLFEAGGVSFWDWRSPFKKSVEATKGLDPDSISLAMTGVKNVIQAFDGEKMAVEYVKPHGKTSTILTLLFHKQDSMGDNVRLRPCPGFSEIEQDILHFIGSYKSKLIFLDKNLWVCSLQLQRGQDDAYRYAKHFFMPADWFSQRRHLNTGITKKGDILFVRTDEIAVIKNGLQYEEGVREIRPSTL